jgi:hypothetical protein
MLLKAFKKGYSPDEYPLKEILKFYPALHKAG